jgi:hypothetical protein
MHVVALYAGILALLYLVLTFRTIVLRGRLRVTLGDGGSEALQRAIRAHANFGEYVPLALVLQLLLASTGASASAAAWPGCSAAARTSAARAWREPRARAAAPAHGWAWCSPRELLR